ncbi:hypothetical protein FOMA001_g13579 [Fusarium oxysporum f. sp. matthiolae]|nr:hypothetical protein FOMA001_g13579 [Fusarium oxysporum f. sp. matthiolae]
MYYDATLGKLERRVRVTTDDELKRFAEVVELGAAGLPTADKTPSELDEGCLCTRESPTGNCLTADVMDSSTTGSHTCTTDGAPKIT